MGLNLRRTLFNPAEPINRRPWQGAGVAVLALADACPVYLRTPTTPLLCDSRHHVLMFHLCPFKEPLGFPGSLCPCQPRLSPHLLPGTWEASLATV